MTRYPHNQYGASVASSYESILTLFLLPAVQAHSLATKRTATSPHASGKVDDLSYLAMVIYGLMGRGAQADRMHDHDSMFAHVQCANHLS